MRQLIQHFCDTLSAEREAHKELLALSRQKKDAITKNDIPSLDKIVKGEEILLARLQHWERQRKECVQAVAGQAGLPARDIALQDFLPLCDTEQHQRLQSLHHELKTLLEQQIDVNDINKRLIESRLEYIDYALNTVAGGGQGAYQTYGGEGREAGRPARKTSIIDQRV